MAAASPTATPSRRKSATAVAKPVSKTVPTSAATPTAVATAPAPTEHLDVLIVGAGISGIDAAYRLQTECPDRSYAILEARHAIGGTWDLFRYPGIRSDSDMSTLGFPFDPYQGDLAIASGEHIREYVVGVAAKHGIDRKVRFHAAVTGADWSSADARWTVRYTLEGEPRALTCNFLFLCAGYYDYAGGYLPDFAGMADYRGTLVHAQQWPEDLDLTGKRVVVIGSGATAVTVVPAIAQTAAKVTMLQRSPSYVVSMPAKDKIAKALQEKLPRPAADALTRWKNILLSIGLYQLARRRPEQTRDRILGMVRKQLPADYDVATHFTPSYMPWDQRVCLVPNGDLFKALRAGKAEVVTDTIERFTERGLLLTSGKQLDADVVVAATGLVIKLFGGVTLSLDGKAIDPAQHTLYRGMMLSGVPNLAFSFGYSNASWTLKCDLTARYVARLLNKLRSKRADVAVPVLQAGDVDHVPLMVIDAGYIARAKNILPQQGAKAPWKVRQNYLLDLAETQLGRVDDGVLRFSRRRDRASNKEGARA